MSPVKKASSGTKYFNCTLQAENSVVRAVCFSQAKHSEISKVQISKSPVLLQNIRTENSNNAKKDVVISKHTKISPLSLTSINCTYSNDITDSSLLTDVASLRQVAAEQLVSLKVEVAHVESVKAIDTQHGSLAKLLTSVCHKP